MDQLVDGGFPVPIPQSIALLEPKLISQGAEALAFLTKHPYLPSTQCIAKYRPPKAYRIAQVDAPLRKQRTTAESRVLQKLASADIPCPAIVFIDSADAVIYMEYVDGPSLKQHVWNTKDSSTNDLLFRQFGELVGKLHSINISHGDLTTSNVLVSPGNVLKLIDFGLSTRSASPLDKAVDLYVLERAILSTHSDNALRYTEQVLEGYKSTAGEVTVMRKLEQVRQRGRKRSMIG